MRGPEEGQTEVSKPERTVIIGIGNPTRCDDGVGHAVARVLDAKGLPNTQVVQLSGEGTALCQAWADADQAFVVDAVMSGAPPGTVRRINVHKQVLPTRVFRGSSHVFGLAEAVELARALDQLPRRLIVYGIEGRNWSNGIGLSPEVVAAARRVAGKITREVRRNK